MNKKRRILSIVLIVVAMVAILVGCKKEQTQASPEVEGVKLSLIAEGATEYVIVRGTDATSTEVKATEELQKYLKKMSGVEIPIVTDDTEAVEKEIIVGKTTREAEGEFDRDELGEDGLIIKTVDSKLWLIGGGDRGTIYSVYTFLEDYLGCRFYTEYVEKVPKTEEVSFVEIEEDKQIPQFKYRDLAWRVYFDDAISAKRKINASVWGRTISEEYGGGYTWALGMGGHSFASFVPRETYFEEHPEYYSMNEEGERISTGQLCLTNSDVLQLVIKGARDWMKQDPDADIITITQNDILNPCMCENCKDVYKEEGGAYSGALLRFVNAVAENLKTDYPDLIIDTYAYQYTRSAPSKTNPADNVIIRLCPIECCHSHPYEEGCDMTFNASYVDNSANVFAQDMKDWSEKCDGNLWLYDYNCNFSFQSMTFPDFDIIRQNYRYYAENGVTGVMPEGVWTNNSVEFGELRCYLLSKLLWNPYMSEEEFQAHMDDFLTGVYGTGGKYIRQYIELANELTEDIHFGISTESEPYVMYPLASIEKHSEDELPKKLTVDMVKNYKDVDWTKYWNWYQDVEENRITAEGEELFEKAIELAKTEQQKADLEKAYMQVKSLKSYYYGKQLAVGNGAITQMIKKFIQEHAKDFTDAEKKTLPAVIGALASKQCSAEYAKYNEKLCAEMVDWGLVQDTASFSNYYKFDFTAIPALWESLGDNVEIPINKVNGNLAKATVQVTDTVTDYAVHSEFSQLKKNAFIRLGSFEELFDVAVPKGLEGKSYLLMPPVSSDEVQVDITVKEDGWIYVLTNATSMEQIKEPLRRQGFKTVAVYPQGTLSSSEYVGTLAMMGKEVKAGETISYDYHTFNVVIAEEWK